MQLARGKLCITESLLYLFQRSLFTELLDLNKGTCSQVSLETIVFLLRNYQLIVAPKKFDVLKTT